MSKVIATFEEKVLAYGKALIEYDEADKACRAHPDGWPIASDPRAIRVEAAVAVIDKLRGPMHTALGHYARFLAK